MRYYEISYGVLWHSEMQRKSHITIHVLQADQLKV